MGSTQVIKSAVQHHFAVLGKGSKDHFKTHLFFSIFGWGDPSQLGSWSEGCVKPLKFSREAIWQVSEDPHHTCVSWRVHHFLFLARTTECTLILYVSIRQSVSLCNHIFQNFQITFGAEILHGNSNVLFRVK